MSRKNPDTQQLDYVGRSIPRKDGPDKVTGRATYTVDIKLPGMLVGRILRSPHPHARILNIDTSRAEQLKGVKAVITAKDTIGVKHGFVETPRYPPDQDPLATDRVRFVGEEVAAVAATDPYVAEEALNLIRVDYEPLPPQELSRVSFLSASQRVSLCLNPQLIERYTA